MGVIVVQVKWRLPTLQKKQEDLPCKLPHRLMTANMQDGEFFGQFFTHTNMLFATPLLVL
jgi:hypothetical protein